MPSSYEDHKYLMTLDVNTGAGIFTGFQSRQLAQLIYLRFGKDINSAHVAYQRLLQNNCDLPSFRRLLFGTL